MWLKLKLIDHFLLQILKAAAKVSKVTAVVAAVVPKSVAPTVAAAPKTAKDAPKPNYAFIAPVTTPNSTSVVPSAGYVSAEVTAGIVGGFPQPSGIGPA